MARSTCFCTLSIQNVVSRVSQPTHLIIALLDKITCFLKQKYNLKKNIVLDSKAPWFVMEQIKQNLSPPNPFDDCSAGQSLYYIGNSTERNSISPEPFLGLSCFSFSSFIVIGVNLHGSLGRRKKERSDIVVVIPSSLFVLPFRTGWRYAQKSKVDSGEGMNKKSRHRKITGRLRNIEVQLFLKFTGWYEVSQTLH